MKQEHNVSLSGRIGNPVRSCYQRTRSRLQPKAIKRIAFERGSSSRREIGRNHYALGLESTSQRAFELAIGDCCFECRPVDTYPGASSRCPGTDIGSHLIIRAKGEPYQATLWRTITADYAATFGFVCRLMPR
jgi:hypothetical protein